MHHNEIEQLEPGEDDTSKGRKVPPAGPVTPTHSLRAYARASWLKLTMASYRTTPLLCAINLQQQYYLEER
jgi:hypothetical protein